MSCSRHCRSYFHPMLNVTSLYFRTCQSTSGLDLPYLHRTHFTTRVSHFLDSSFVLHFTLWQVARKTFIVLNLVACVSLLCTVLPTKEMEGGGRAAERKQFVENTEIVLALQSHDVESQPHFLIC